MSSLVLQLVGNNELCTHFISYNSLSHTLHTAVGFLLRNSHLGNKSVVSLDEIGEGAGALLCLTNSLSCCEKSNDGTAGSMWYFPDLSPVPLGTQGSGLGVYTTRGPSVVGLHRRSNSTMPAGIFHCEIPDASGIIQRIYIGVYPDHEVAGILKIYSLRALRILLVTPPPPPPLPPTHTLT